MAYSGRFQRLNQTDDIALQNPTADYFGNYGDAPTPGSQGTPSSQDMNRTSYTTRKPVPTRNQTQEPLINNYFDASPPIDSSEKPTRRQTDQSLLSKYASSLWAKTPISKVSHLAAPLFAAPWRHEPCKDLGGSQASTVREFDRSKQRRRIFFHLFLQWLITLTFSGIIIGVLYHYDSEDLISHKAKYWFNTLFLGLSLCLGFAVVSGLKECANILRWRLLASRYRSLQEFELVLGLASQRKALRLLWVSRYPGSWLPSGTQIICFCYLVLMIGLQILIALLGLCQSVDPSTEYVDSRENGNVSIVDLKSIVSAGDDVRDPELTQTLLAQTGSANTYGVISQSFDVVYNPTPNDYASFASETLFTDNQTFWAAQFVDQCTEKNCTSTRISSRFVTVNAVCQEYRVTGGGYVSDGNITWIYPNGTEGYFPYFDYPASSATTWFADVNSTCGERCSQIYGINIGYKDDETDIAPRLFDCNNVVGQVGDQDYTYPEDSPYALPEEQARFIAGAIGCNGIESYGNTGLNYQYRLYDASSPWSYTQDIDNNREWDASYAANLVMRFSAGVLAAMDDIGPRTFTTGYEPIPAQSVDVLWRWAIIILGLINGIPLLCVLATVVVGNSAVIKDDSHLASARLLRPIVERMERNGCALTSDEICEMLGNPRIAYGLTMPNAGGAVPYRGHAGSMVGGAPDEIMHLGILRESALNDPRNQTGASHMGWQVGGRMPQGRYDGVFDHKPSHVEEERVGLISGVAATEGDRTRKRRMSF